MLPNNPKPNTSTLGFSPSNVPSDDTVAAGSNQTTFGNPNPSTVPEPQNPMPAKTSFAGSSTNASLNSTDDTTKSILNPSGFSSNTQVDDKADMVVANSGDFMSTNTPGSGDDNNIASGVVGSPQVPTKYGGKKIIATIFGVVLLIAGVAAGVYLVNNQQELREKASSGAECSQHSTECILLDSPGNQGSFTAPRTIDHLFITARDEFRFDSPGRNDGCYNVTINGSSMTWERLVESSECKDISNIQIWLGGAGVETPTVTPSDVPTASLTPTGGVTVTTSPSPTPTGSPSGSPTATTPPTQTTAQCSAVKVYSTNWTQLTAADMAELDPGDTVRITVSGTASSGTFTKARFIINGVTGAEVTAKKPGTNEFYKEYTIPNGVTNFSFNGEVNHSELGWI